MAQKELLKVGWWVAVTLKPNTAPLRCYAGQVQAIGPEGLRLTLIDWIAGSAMNWDLFIPHANIESMLIATDEHDQRAFGEAAGKWQTAMNDTVKAAEDAAKLISIATVDNRLMAEADAEEKKKS
jgi:hypothetical protein